LKFCSAVAVLPLHHPIQFAERAALLDVLSNGRLSVGVGRGYQRRAFEGYNVTMEDSSERFDEYLDVIKRAWGPDPFTYSGRYYSNPEPISVNPKPVQKPHPPIWVAGVSFHSLEKIGRGDYGFIKNFADNLDTCREQVEVYRKARRAAGLPITGDRARIGRQTCVLDDQREADAAAEKYARQFQSLFASAVSKPPVGDSYAHYRSEQYQRDRGLGQEFDYRRYAEFSIFGDASAAVDKIRRLREMGYTEIDFNLGFGGMPTEMVRRVMRTLAENVIPHFK
jgi:alkanesulfonate monooxygenase SsuD/methylene tetrahydromethanopterin reductase-like flavin-dependent oxidoreductase (luciferase family)